MKPILEVRDVSKKFLIDHEGLPYLSFRDRISGVLKPKPKKEEFWALKDVSFNVMPGNSVGIIGRNGAGKSTLLKILSRITPPTKGSIVARGRIASLLEVGTGFHSELTGRENIFMNGSILGMKRAEINKRFDEIIDFSGVEKFLDTPLKHYSSGMQLRLAFAVAAHLEPEILIVDEVLAVGDAEFQKKCLGKMEEVSKSGRTILFVSHHMGAVESLCDRGIVLSNGEIGFNGKSSDAIRYYFNRKKLTQTDSENFVNLSQHPNKKCDKEFGLQKAVIKINGKNTNILTSGDTLEIDFSYQLKQNISNLVMGLVIRDSYGAPIIGVNNNHTAQKLSTNGLSGVVKFKLENFGSYGKGECGVDLYFGDNGDDFDTILDAFTLEMYPADSFKTGVFVNTAFNKVYQPLISFNIQ